MMSLIPAGPFWGFITSPLEELTGEVGRVSLRTSIRGGAVNASGCGLVQASAVVLLHLSHSTPQKPTTTTTAKNFFEGLWRFFTR